MSNIIEITDFGAGELDVYARLTEVQLLNREFPESYYIVFSHPPFHYLSENDEVMRRVGELAWDFNPETIGYEWNETVC